MSETLTRKAAANFNWTMTHSMNTMLDLLTRLVEMRQCCQRVRDNSQLTDGEKAAAQSLKNVVREGLPAPLLVTYDRMKETEAELLECPEVFAMAVLVATYGRSPEANRKKLPARFANPLCAAAPTRHNGTRRISRNAMRLIKTIRADLVGEPWSR